MTEGSNGGLNVVKVSLAVKGAIDALGNVEMGGIRLNQASGELLDLNSLSLDIHVAMHPAAIAYYGALKKEASRRLSAEKRSYDRWSKRKWAEAKVKCGGDYKPTREDIESRLVVDNSREMEDWEKRIDELQEQMDTLDVWFEAWRQKSFAMRDHVSMDEEERFSSNPSMGGGTGEHRVERGRTDAYDGAQTREDLNSEKIRKVRDIIRKRRNAPGV